MELSGRSCLEGALPGPGPHPPRRTTFALEGPRTVEAAWPRSGASRLIETRRPDGRLFLAIDHDTRAGYRIEAPGYGTHVVTSDGRAWIGATAPGPAWHWQKLVFAQVLPTIAVLHGLELFHASAVAVDGCAYGLIAPSGMGKSSTAAHLVARGARFFSDDVLAVEQVSGQLIAHPGPQFANVHGHELDAMDTGARSRVGALMGESDKRHLRPAGVAGALPLGALIFLTRAAGGRGAHVETVGSDPRRLLASTFAPHVGTGSRLERQLAVCATMDREMPLWQVIAGPGSTAGDVAAVLWRRLVNDHRPTTR